MSIIHDKDKLPYPGEFVKSVVINEKHYIAEIEFESGKKVCIHLTGR